MSNHEEIRYDEPWEGDIPFLDYWSLRFRKRPLTKEQESFFAYFCENIKHGRYVEVGDEIAYVALLKDKIISKYRNNNTLSAKASLLAQARFLVCAYDYQGTDLDNILRDEALMRKQLRLNEYKKQEPARWIEPGESVTEEGHNFTRGGFYLGQSLGVSRYDAPACRFHSGQKLIEGPVVNLSKSPKKGLVDDLKPFVSFDTFVEMNENIQQNLLGWLEGSVEPCETALTYYISGFEVRLLADRNADNESRRNAMLALCNLYREQHQNLGAINRSRIISMIDCAATRYFDDISFLPEKIRDGLSNYNNFRIGRQLYDRYGNTDLKPADIIPMVKVPDYLPEEFHEDYLNRFQNDLRIYSQYRFQPYNSTENTYYKTRGHYELGYYPDETLENTLNGPITSIPEKIMKHINVLSMIERQLSQTLSQFRHASHEGKSVLGRMLALPSWCNASKMPGSKEALASITPPEGKDYILLPLSEVLDKLGKKATEGKVPLMEYTNLYFMMSRLHLSLVPDPNFMRSANLNATDMVAVMPFNQIIIPTRGVIRPAMEAIALLIQGDADDRDWALIDNWIADYAAGADWEARAKATMRFMHSRKITMSQRRKTNIAKITRHAHRLQSLKSLLLSLVADPERATKQRMKRLEQIYTVLGQNPADIHSDLHRLATEGTPTKKSRQTGRKYSGVDKSKLKSMAKSTREAQQLLAEVFTEKEDATEQSPGLMVDTIEESTAKPADGIADILSRLAAKEDWPREEFDSMAKEYGLTTGALLEKLNDYSFDAAGCAVAEDEEDNIYIDTETALHLAGK